MDSKTIIKCLLLNVCLLLANIDEAICVLDELECPLDCECHYFRVNWVTDCSESNLTAIPYDWLSLGVYVLNMNGNNIATLDAFPEDIKLRRLQVADNELSELKKDYFKGLGLLLDADFSGNKITKVDPDAFQDSPGLLTLELQNNPLLPVKEAFLVSRSLMYLDLSSCQLTYISPHFFQNTTALRKLDLSQNPLHTIGSDSFNNLTSLEELKLNQCNLSHIDGDAFVNLTNLKNLELSDNILTTVNWNEVLGSLTLLESLDLKHSRITHLLEDAFASNSWLRNLILAENELRDLEVATTLGHNLKHLDMLDLSNCRLRGPLSEDAFANATKLRTLLLSGNPLSAGDLAVALRPLVRLHKLSLRNCSLLRLPGHTFHLFDQLHELDISMNPLNDAFTGLLTPLDTLESLDMSYSNLSMIASNTFSKMSHLRRLVLSGNPLTYLESGLFKNLTSLETLELNNCGLTRIPDNTVFFNNSFADLQQLSLRDNPFEVDNTKPLFPEQLSKLETIDLSGCNLTVLPEQAFETTPNIKTLKLSRNKLGVKDNDATLAFIHSLHKLSNLDLSANQLKTLSPEAFHFNRYIASLNLVGNPWKCTCDIADMWHWAAEMRRESRVLIGSTTTPEDVTTVVTGGKRRRAGLMCNYESTEDFPKDRRYLKRVKDATTSRTWAKYVKEATCDVRTFVAEPTAEEQVLFNQMAIASISSYKHFHLNDSMPRWLVTVVAIAVFYSLSIVAIVVYVQASHRLKLTRIGLEEQARKEREYYEQEAKLELMKYLQHPRAGGSSISP